MTFWTLIRRSLRFHVRSHLGVVLGAAIGSAALIGALVVGDSLRESLRQMALARLGEIHVTMNTGDRLFRSALANQPATFFGGSSRSLAIYPPAIRRAFLMPGTNHNYKSMGVLALPATASAADTSRRANHVQLVGVSKAFSALARSPIFSNLPPDSVVLNESLASHLRLRVGDSVVLRVRKPEALSADSPIAPQDESSVVLRLQVQAIARAAELGNFSLRANQIPPFNAFVSLQMLQDKADALGRANLLLAGAGETCFPRKRWFDPLFQLLKWQPKWLPPPTGLTTNALSTETLTALLSRLLQQNLQLEDLQLQMRLLPNGRGMELRSPRIFIDEPVVNAITAAATTPGSTNASPPRASANQLFPAPPFRVLTYLVSQIRAAERSTPYSMVTATDSSLLPADLRDDEIVINQWLAEDLQAGLGTEIELTYYLPDEASRLIEATNRFRIRSVLPMNHPLVDRTLMPDFPGISKAERAGDWDTSFHLVHEIRPKDDQYWRDYRGTPKAFVTMAAGRRMWRNRFGSVTAVRFPFPENHKEQFSYLRTTEIERAVRRVFDGLIGRTSPSVIGRTSPLAPALPGVSQMDLATLGFRPEPVRRQALTAAGQSQDFGQLFLGFSFFLILAALILMALLFQFGLEQRAEEVGTLLALGFTPKLVRRLLLLEGCALALLGGVIGVAGSMVYARAMLHGLTTMWREAVGTSSLSFHITPLTLVIGLLAALVVSALTIWLVLRKQARQPARELLSAQEVSSFKFQVSRLGLCVAVVAGFGAVGIVGWALWAKESANAGAFFGAGTLCLIGGLAALSTGLARLSVSEGRRRLTLSSLGLRGCTRRRKRSLATVALLACGSFMIVAVGANRLEANRDAWKRSSGTGGFALLGESTLPIVHDLNSQAGREFFGLDTNVMAGVAFVPFRVRDGDDASCLNLNRAQSPRLLGVKPELLQNRGAFTFAKVAKGLPSDQPWMLLRRAAQSRSSRGNEAHSSSPPVEGQSLVTSAATPGMDDTIPAIGDAASIQWALGKKIGDTLTYRDERGQPFKVRLVGAVANSILQGSLIIDEEQLVARFPGESGYRMFLIDTPSNSVAQVSATLSRALQDVGLELTPAPQRLAAFNAVQNTYLNTFQILGGLGLLLGSAGLGVVVLRNVLERRGELALLQAVGFRKRSLQWLVLSEHGGLLGLGLSMGILAALVAVLPALLAPGAQIHYLSLGSTLAGVLLSGLAWTCFATWLALRGRLLEALRNE